MVNDSFLIIVGQVVKGDLQLKIDKIVIVWDTCFGYLFREVECLL
jgi:hypothetical protein